VAVGFGWGLDGDRNVVLIQLNTTQTNKYGKHNTDNIHSRTIR